ncbi:hypothetical protein [Haladaptatus sp. NG-SE-30]
MIHSRRVFLTSTATVLTVAVAGCTNLPGSTGQDNSPQRDAVDDGNPIPAARLQMTAVENRDIGERQTLSTRENSEKGRRVIKRAVQNGSTIVDDQSPPIWEGSTPWVYDGSVYRVSYDVRNERPATRYFWNLTPVQQANKDDIVRFDELPRLDREKFRLVGLGDVAVGDDTPLDIGKTFVYANADRNQSALVPTPDRSVIEWKSGSRARFSITGSNSKDATLKTYRYTAHQLASTVEAYGQQLRDKYTFELSGLADAERNLVNQAIAEHGYTVERGGSPPDAFWSLVDTFQQHEAVADRKDGVTGDYLTTFDGQVYWTELINGNDYGVGKTTTTEQ